MAKYTKDDALTGLRLGDGSNGLVISKEAFKPQTGKDGDGAEFDFRGQLDRMAKAAKERQAQQGTGMKITDFDPVGGLLNRDSLLDPVERLLREARQLMQEGKFREAFVPLDKVLAESAGHLEARYLKAYCFAHLKSNAIEDDAQALLLLRPLRDAALDTTLKTRIQGLLELIRGRRLVYVFVQSLILLDQGSDDGPRFLRREIELDPDVGIYYFMLAGGLLNAGRSEEAVTAAQAGLPCCRGDERKNLEKLIESARRRMVEQALQPALHHYKRGKYAQALGAVSKLPPVHREVRVCMVFEDYLRALSGGATGLLGSLFAKSKTPADVSPNGTPEDLDALGFFLTREELGRGKAKLNVEDRDLVSALEAEGLLGTAVNLAPFFLYANFLFGTAMFVRVHEQIGSGSPPPLETAEADLQRARQFVEYAGNDPELSVADGLKAIDRSLKMFDEVKKKRAEFATEAKDVNGAIEEFKSIMDFVGDGINSPQKYRQVRDRMVKLQQRVPALKRIARSDNGKQAVQQLTEAVERHMQQLGKIQNDVDDAETIESHFNAFRSKMDSLKSNPISSRYQLEQEKRFFENLRNQAQTDRTRLKGNEAKQAIDNLIRQLNEVLKMMAAQ